MQKHFPKYKLSDFTPLCYSLIKYLQVDPYTVSAHCLVWFRLLTRQQDEDMPMLTQSTHISHQLKLSFGLDSNSQTNDLNRYAYKTQVQLYKSLLHLKDLLSSKSVIPYEEAFLMNLDQMIKDVECSFASRYSVAITDDKTVFSICNNTLNPTGDEPVFNLLADQTCYEKAITDKISAIHIHKIKQFYGR
jgi:hypothetical protein